MQHCTYVGVYVCVYYLCYVYVLRIQCMCVTTYVHICPYVRTCAYIGDTVYNVCMYTCACVCRVPINIPLSHASLEKVKDH